MNKGITIILTLMICAVEIMHAQDFERPDTVLVHSGRLILRALLWRPVGQGPFPSIIYCHGNWGSNDSIDSSKEEASLLGPVFAKMGYAFLSLFRTVRTRNSPRRSKRARRAGSRV